MLHKNICYSFLKIYVNCFAEKNFTCINTIWGSWEPWEPCRLKEDCGNGYRFRRRKCCLNGGNNQKRNYSMCGIPPRQIQSCYKLCQGNKLLFNLVQQVHLKK